MNVLLFCRNVEVGENIIRNYKLKKEEVACFYNRREAVAELCKVKQKPKFIVADVEMRNKEARVFLRQVREMKLNASIMEFWMSQSQFF